MPVGDVLVGNTRGNIEHDDTALAVDIVSISKTTELLLTSSIPHIELNGSQVLSPADYRLVDKRSTIFDWLCGDDGGAYGREI